VDVRHVAKESFPVDVHEQPGLLESAQASDEQLQHTTIHIVKNITFIIIRNIPVVSVQNEGHSIAPTPQAPVRNRQTIKVANAKVRIG